MSPLQNLGPHVPKQPMKKDSIAEIYTSCFFVTELYMLHARKIATWKLAIWGCSKLKTQLKLQTLQGNEEIERYWCALILVYANFTNSLRSESRVRRCRSSEMNCLPLREHVWCTKRSQTWYWCDRRNEHSIYDLFGRDYFWHFSFCEVLYLRNRKVRTGISTFIFIDLRDRSKWMQTKDSVRRTAGTISQGSAERLNAFLNTVSWQLLSHRKTTHRSALQANMNTYSNLVGLTSTESKPETADSSFRKFGLVFICFENEHIYIAQKYHTLTKLTCGCMWTVHIWYIGTTSPMNPLF